MNDNEIDQADRQILAILQRNAEASIDRIAADIDLSPSAVHRRVSRLKKVGVIRRIAAVVDPKKVRRALTVLVEIDCESEKPDALERFKRWTLTQQSVQSCWYAAGEVDFLLVVVVADLDEYTEFTVRLMADRLGVRTFRSLIVLQTVKQSLEIDLL
jgi:DNA-binding Lrp family transcriptional regulator